MMKTTDVVETFSKYVPVSVLKVKSSVLAVFYFWGLQNFVRNLDKT